MVSRILRFWLLAIVLVALSMLPTVALAASCCGGGSSSALIMPKFARSQISLSLDAEDYNGFWDGEGVVRPDPEGSDLAQYRLNVGLAQRLAGRWQASLVLPYVWNDNLYTGLSSNTQGPGDARASVWYEFFDEVTCVYQVHDWGDLRPSVYLGGSLTLPTGISRFDTVQNSFDITGRGFYRLDANLMLEKTVYPWSGSLLLSYGKHLERAVNRDYGSYVEPYRRNLGGRYSSVISAGYTHFLESLSSLTLTLAYSYLAEEAGTIDGRPDLSTRMQKQAVAATLSWSNMPRDWVLKLGLSHALPDDGRGQNFPITNILSLRVDHVLR